MIYKDLVVLVVMIMMNRDGNRGDSCVIDIILPLFITATIPVDFGFKLKP